MQVRNAGSVFVGPWSPVAAGDYATGGNHVLPTNGWARSVGGLGLETFLKPVTVQRLTEDGLARIRPTIEALAAAEGMPAHAEAARSSMRGARPEFAARTPGRARRPTRSRGSPASIRRRCCGSTRTRRRSRLPRRGRARSRARSRASAATRRAATASCAGRSRTTPACEPENVVLGAGADDLILLCARAYAGPGDTIAVPAAPTYPLFRIAAQLAGAEIGDVDPVLDVRLPPEQPDRRARAAAGRAAARRRRGVLRVQRRRRRSPLLDDGVIVLRTFSKLFGSRARASATRSPRARRRTS